jgi:small subunit ribosomal protein S21
MSVHIRGNGREIGKRGLCVEVKYSSTPAEATRNMDAAIRSLKRKVVQEGVIRDIRKKEFYETKSQLRRKKNRDAIKRQRKLAKLARERDK